ncbi:protein kinase-like protein [Euroglyphus maynei]|uniref:non-specific serine/threonine protein kinase n=1 Tax=Euroglyphus maynei TaxID=6958 RepID=A0A1Y3BG69_EURMA|nr:protein kinase-like protein [Euroglyphus maynei]
MAAGLYDITNDVLGKGHFAIVKLARHCLTGEHVAIKIVDKIKLTKEGLEQLSCEIKLWSILSRHEHPNVVKLYQCIDTRTKLYLVMEYCGNNVCDLYDYIQKKNDGDGLDANEAKHIFKQICKAIFYCHSLKIVHRDLKPENILIINNQQEKSDILVKLIDFGFSNQWCEDELLRTSCGSLAYSAPEILLGNQYDGPKVDIWSLGCILYILLYGHNPFMQYNDNETLIKILDCSFTTPEKSSVNESSIDLIQSLLKKDPNMRLSIEEVLNHPWLDEQQQLDLSTIDLSAKKEQIKANKNLVHDYIIDQMINQGISISKDQIRKIIRNEHIETIAESNDSSAFEYSVNDHHYIKATYQLLKDKSTREFKGQTDPNHQINKFRQNKRGNITRKRGEFIRSDSHTIANDNNNLDKQKIFSPLSGHTQSLTNLDLPQNSTSYVLPLARKCSIVSEEGSICAENSLQDNSLTCIDTKIQECSNGDDDNNKHPKQHLIDIFVTDSSSNIAKKWYCILFRVHPIL